MKTEKWYVVERPIRGTQTFLVEAKSAKEAKKKVDDGDADNQVLDFDIKFHGLATYAKIDV